jgi:hypothetical protein
VAPQLFWKNPRGQRVHGATPPAVENAPGTHWRRAGPHGPASEKHSASWNCVVLSSSRTYGVRDAACPISTG